MSAESKVTAAIVVIGDEILSGRTRDINVQQIAEFLNPIGIGVSEVRIVTDETDAIVNAVRALSDEYDYVFTTGGIGPTHDDITADSVARAFDRSIDIRDDALSILQDWYDKAGTELTEARKRMARIPDGASLIDNPVTGAPGFQIENVFVLAGVPKIVRGMLEDVGHRLEGGAVTHSVSVRLEGVREGDIAESLSELVEEFPEISLGSYPWFEDEGEDGIRRGVVLVARGTDPDQLKEVKKALRSLSAS